MNAILILKHYRNSNECNINIKIEDDTMHLKDTVDTTKVGVKLKETSDDHLSEMQSKMDDSVPEQSKLSRTKNEPDGAVPYKSSAALFVKASIAVSNPNILQMTWASNISKLLSHTPPHTLLESSAST